ncbi:S8 family peptidase [Angustibacter luteus]|uniref:S8 family serine peptidase n=1 Tax=Angustibacter luteus TaxID=658456 RepID=A0ABW1JCM3_9ACTN
MRTTVGLATLALSIGLVTAPTLTASATSPTAPVTKPHRVGPPTVKTVTLVTGDVVQVTSGADKRHTVTLLPRPDGTVPQAAINDVHGHLYVVPVEAFGLLAAKRLDRDLFDVTALLADDYDDASRPSLPVLVDYGRGSTAATQAKAARLDSARRTLTIPALGVAAFAADKKHARAFWDDLTTGADRAGHPTGLADGAARVDLDGQVTASLEHSVPQIHAPQAWAAGFTGTGATVAVLDTGYDSTHPDLAGRVSKTANFTTDATVTDGNGHGTHVLSTVGGTGAASGGLRKGVAPGADLMVGKVLGDNGSGEDSWVLAGMAWAVAQGADVVSMSLGNGTPDDGTNPLALAVDELSASSDTLFVIAAGNEGGNGASTVSAPGSADAALTVGAVDVHDAMAGFSSRGPRVRDGALKPDVVGPGVDITAARAAGTELGPVVDEYYTTISGTSMATPHVAGLAAILKQEHPGWDGERLKSAIANSTVQVADATGFDAGTGRIDALQAIHQDVLAPASLSLGNYSWPYSDLSPTSTTLTYTNTGAAPVTLSLALTGEDGAAEPTGSMKLAASTLTVPASGTASTAVVLDPTVAKAGAYSAVVTATVASGGGTVRTALAYQLEPERYDVKVTIKPRAGSQNVTHQLGLSGYGEPWVYEQRTFDASTGAQSATFRLPPGTYGTGAISFGLAKDGAHEGVVSYNPSFTVSKNTEIVLDENAARRFDYRVDKPVVDGGAILDVSWNGDAGYTGFTFFGSVDRLYAQPSKGLAGGTAAVAANWLLSEPEGLIVPRRGKAVPLRPVTAAGAVAYETPVPRLNGDLRVVDAGPAAAPRLRKVKGAVALVAGTCTDLGATAAALKKAGAAAMVAYAGRGQSCAGTMEGTPVLPSFQARPMDVPGLLTHSAGRAHVVTHANTGYMYDLVHYWADGVPNGGTVDGTGRAVTALVETYNGLGSTSNDGLRVVEELIGWVPERDGTANIGLERTVRFPSTVTHYVSTGAEWERTVSVVDATYGGEYGRLWAPRQTFAGGATHRETWFGGPIGSRVSPQFQLTNGAPPPVRENDEMFLSMGAYTDAYGHMANSDLFNDQEFNGKIYADDELVLDMFASVFMNTTVPAGKHRYRVITDTQRDNLFWRLSTRVRTEWGFDSDTPADFRTILPMLGVDYRMALSATGSAPAGRYRFGVDFVMPNGVATVPVVKRSVDVSWNGGTTWKPASLACGTTSCQVRVTNKSGAKASLRVRATDSAGRTVSQEITDAYSVR